MTRGAQLDREVRLAEVVDSRARDAHLVQKTPEEVIWFEHNWLGGMRPQLSPARGSFRMRSLGVIPSQVVPALEGFWVCRSFVWPSVEVGLPGLNAGEGPHCRKCLARPLSRV